MYSIYDSHELSNAFNDHVSSIGPKLANNIHANEDNSSHLDYLAETGHCTFDGGSNLQVAGRGLQVIVSPIQKD